MYLALKERLFGKLDINSLDDIPDFKEDSVREAIILPLLKELGYKQQDIFRSKTLLHPFLKIGSKKRPVTLIPDYAMMVEGSFAWVLDAKAPQEKVTDSDNIEQVYSYATHPEIRSTYFAICNGLEFALFRRELTSQPILCFSLNDIEHYWSKMQMYLSPSSFQVGKNFTYETTTATSKPTEFDYKSRPPQNLGPANQAFFVFTCFPY